MESSDLEKKPMSDVGDSYLREQLEKRREELAAVIPDCASADPSGEVYKACCGISEEVGLALDRMDKGTYGICEVCHDPVEKERLLADPLARLCLDHLSGEEARALERDLELASRIQRGLLPAPNLRRDGWQIHYQYKPAGLVSGDYCDVILPAEDGGRIIFLLGDVAGKGVAASLLMTHLHAMFRSLAGVGLELDRLLERANRVFCESTLAGQYATLVGGRISRSGELELSSAGHLAALAATRDGVKRISATGLPLGMFSTSRYAVQKLRLDPGDSLLLFTDGISETRNTSGSEYGISRLARVVEERHGWVPQELLAACLRDVERFSSGTPPADDRTLMVVHRAQAEAAAIAD